MRSAGARTRSSFAPRPSTSCATSSRTADRVIGKDELIQAVWQGQAVTDDALVQCIRSLRQALSDGDQRIIRTVRRRGYLFCPGARRGALAGAGRGPEPGHRVLPHAGRRPAGDQCGRPRDAGGEDSHVVQPPRVRLARPVPGRALPLSRRASAADPLRWPRQRPVRPVRAGHLLRGLRAGSRDGGRCPPPAAVRPARHLPGGADRHRARRAPSRAGLAPGAQRRLRARAQQARLGEGPRDGTGPAHADASRLGRRALGLPEDLQHAVLPERLRRGAQSPRRAAADGHVSGGGGEASPGLRRHRRRRSPAERVGPDAGPSQPVRQCGSLRGGRRLAAAIPNARFVALESENHVPLPDEPAWPQFISEIEAFLRE